MSFNIDSKSILVDALKYDLEDFKNSNLILKNERALKALYMVDELKQDLMEFDPKSASRAFATPRSWTFVSQFLGDEDATDAELVA